MGTPGCVARRLAGNDALYWRRREFAYPSQSRVDFVLGHVRHGEVIVHQQFAAALYHLIAKPDKSLRSQTVILKDGARQTHLRSQIVNLRIGHRRHSHFCVNAVISPIGRSLA